MTTVPRRRTFVIHAFASLAAFGGAACRHHHDRSPTRVPVPPVAPRVNAPSPDARSQATDAAAPLAPIAPPADASLGDEFGYGGLGTFATGRMGGSEGTIGLGNIGTMGHGVGTGSSDGYGGGPRMGGHGRRPTHALVRAGAPTVTGLLAPEAVRRVVLRNLGQVSHCHEQGLAQNPNAEGHIVARFLILGEGTVAQAVVAQSSYTLPSVGACIANAIRRWQFPSPEGGGVVTVNEPFDLSHPE